jgi:hypothetical protein
VVLVLEFGGKNSTIRGFLRVGPSASGYILIVARCTSSAFIADQRCKRNFGICALRVSIGGNWEWMDMNRGGQGWPETETMRGFDLDKPDTAVALLEHEVFVWVGLCIIFVVIIDLKWLRFFFHHSKNALKPTQ